MSEVGREKLRSWFGWERVWLAPRYRTEKLRSLDSSRVGSGEKVEWRPFIRERSWGEGDGGSGGMGWSEGEEKCLHGIFRVQIEQRPCLGRRFVSSLTLK